MRVVANGCVLLARRDVVPLLPDLEPRHDERPRRAADHERRPDMARQTDELLVAS
jgi:hypothetical protein